MPKAKTQAKGKRYRYVCEVVVEDFAPMTKKGVRRLLQAIVNEGNSVPGLRLYVRREVDLQ